VVVVVQQQDRNFGHGAEVHEGRALGLGFEPDARQMGPKVLDQQLPHFQHDEPPGRRTEPQDHVPRQVAAAAQRVVVVDARLNS